MDWIFQANPKRYDLAAALEAGSDVHWAMNQGHNLVSPGDRVFFWESGSDAKLLAVGRVSSPVYEREAGEFGRHAVDVAYDFRVEPPLTRLAIAALKNRMSTAPAFMGFMGTNLRLLDSEMVAELDDAIRSRLVAISAAAPSSNAVATQLDLDKAIKSARRATASELHEHVAAMHPTAFEWLVRALLVAIGYIDVEVTKQSGDGGIDVRATLVAGGIAHIATAVQVKRTKTVMAPVVQNLRGSLSAHESGLLITSGRFTEGARIEAREPNKAPIALIDGTAIVELMLEHEIGAKRKVYMAYALDLAALDLDVLKGDAVSELSD